MSIKPICSWQPLAAENGDESTYARYLKIYKLSHPTLSFSTVVEELEATIAPHASAGVAESVSPVLPERARETTN
jgi:hypothetical protein